MKLTYQQAFHREIHLQTTNHTLYHRHLHRLATLRLLEICSPEFQRQYQTLLNHPIFVENHIQINDCEILLHTKITTTKYPKNLPHSFSYKFQNQLTSNDQIYPTTCYLALRLYPNTYMIN